MAKIPSLTSEKLIKVLLGNGFVLDHQTGSHRVYFNRNTRKRVVVPYHILFIAMASCAEVQSHLYVAQDQGYIGKSEFDQIYNQADKTARMIFGLIKYLRSSTKQTK